MPRILPHSHLPVSTICPMVMVGRMFQNLRPSDDIQGKHDSFEKESRIVCAGSTARGDDNQQPWRRRWQGPKAAMRRRSSFMGSSTRRFSKSGRLLKICMGRPARTQLSSFTNTSCSSRRELPQVVKSTGGMRLFACEWQRLIAVSALCLYYPGPQ